MAGKFDPAQQGIQGGSASLSGELGALPGAEVTGHDQFVEPIPGAVGGGDLGRIGEQLARRPHRLRLRLRLGGLRQCRQLRIVRVENAGEHGQGRPVHHLVQLTRLCVRVDGAGDDVGGVGLPAPRMPT